MGPRSSDDGHPVVVTPAKAGAHKHRACGDDTLLLQSLGYTDNEIERTLDERQFFVCILASRKHGTLYIGVYGPRLSPG